MTVAGPTVRVFPRLVAALLLMKGGITSMRLFVGIAAAVLLVGCRSHTKRTADQFAFLEVGMPMTIVSNRVGMPDLDYRGQIRWRYQLADESEIAIVAEGEKGNSFETWRVVWFGQTRAGKWLWVKPPESK